MMASDNKCATNATKSVVVAGISDIMSGLAATH